MSRASNTAGHITTDTDSATHGEESTLATSGTARSVLAVVGIGGSTPEVVGGLETEKRDGHVGLDIRDSSKLLQQLDGDAVLGFGLVNITCHANRAVIILYINGVLQADGDASKRTLEVDGAIFDPFLGIFNEDFSNTVGLFMCF